MANSMHDNILQEHGILSRRAARQEHHSLSLPPLPSCLPVPLSLSLSRCPAEHCKSMAKNMAIAWPDIARAWHTETKSSTAIASLSLPPLTPPQQNPLLQYHVHRMATTSSCHALAMRFPCSACHRMAAIQGCGLLSVQANTPTTLYIATMTALHRNKGILMTKAPMYEQSRP
jgi:hypothetical protein